MDWEELVRQDDGAPAVRAQKAALPVYPLALATVLVMLLANGLQSKGLQPDIRKEWSSSELTGFLHRLMPGHARSPEYFITDLNSWVAFKQSGVGSGWAANSGSVRPREMRVWAPSQDLTNYRVRFTAQLDRKAMSWAFRANDANNYYATRIVITQPGPLPRANIVHYATIKGVRQALVTSPLPIQIRNDTLYHVEALVHGSQFTTSINGHIVDTWSDARLQRGGVGFFSEADEEARVYSLSVTNSDSLTGTLAELLSFAIPMPAGLQ